MKNLLLRKVGPVIGGILIQGDPDIIIKHVAVRKNNQFTNNIIVFYRKNMVIPTNLKACAIVTNDKYAASKFPKSYTIVYVKDVRQAYWRFVSYYRSLFQLPVIGVTGTCGKTTTKEMIAHILSFNMNVVKTVLSQNGLSNNIKYLLQIDEQTDAAVIEMGVNSIGHILHTANYFKPTIGIITTIGIDHLQGFKDHNSYIKEKESMFTAVNTRGTILLNADDDNTKKLNKSKFKGRFIYIGQAEYSNFKIEKIKYHQNGMRYIFTHKGHAYFGFVPGYGRHNVYNAMFAIAASNLLGVSIKEAIKRLTMFKPVKRHLQLYSGLNGSTIIDDTWNTNPTSINAALEVLAELSKEKKSIAILGDIEELGDYSIQEHRKVGELIVNHKIDYLITIGDLAKEIATRAKELSKNPNGIYSIEKEEQLIKVMKQIADKHTVILVKTSMRKSFRELMTKLKRSI